MNLKLMMPNALINKSILDGAGEKKYFLFEDKNMKINNFWQFPQNISLQNLKNIKKKTLIHYQSKNMKWKTGDICFCSHTLYLFKV